MFKWFSSLFDSNEKQLNRLQPLVIKINSLEPEFSRLTDTELSNKTVLFKKRFIAGESLDDLLPEAYAAVREAAKRTIKQRHYDVQLIGGIVLHQAKITEMKTGEGKTLVATLPLYLNSLSGKGCHLVTVNDYLAKRDCYWMGPIYNMLGASVACINARQDTSHPYPSYIYDPNFDSGDLKWKHLRPISFPPNQPHKSRREAYEADITYGTNNEFAFDYLRDNMVLDLSQCVHRSFNYSIVDEVDNILIDEARTPLIISGAADEATQKYYTFASLTSRLKANEDYTIDEKTRKTILTEIGNAKVEDLLRKAGLLKAPNLYDPSNYLLTQHIESAIKARTLFRKDRDYVVKDGQVIIVDEFTGRLMFGRRYSEGLHQAIEAKEGVKIQRESVTMATITFQNYFRLYKKLAGMTGTAATEAEEFHEIYKLEVVVVPTNKPLARIEYTDPIYKDEQSKFKAVAIEVEQLHNQKVPVLIGTTSIEKSEILSNVFTQKGIPHQVLNAKNHEREAEIIAQAGRLEAVTIATNMAGRGVDIILGGNQEGRDQTSWLEEHNKVIQLGGLHIIGTDHHDARRIDNQLRGRSGRQGDPGCSRFYSSLEDDIVRRFGGDRIAGLMERFGIDEDTPIEHPLVSKAIRNAQVQTEGYHFDMRKHLVEYDDVINKHREIIYAERRKILGGADLKTNLLSMINDEIQSVVESNFDQNAEKLNVISLSEGIETIFPMPKSLVTNDSEEFQVNSAEIVKIINRYAVDLYNQREQELSSVNMRVAERLVMLRVIDRLWIEHLTAMDHMRLGIGLRAVAQQKPLDVYKREGQVYFDTLLTGIRHDVACSIYHVGIRKETPRKQKVVIAGKKVGRNDLCPCGSGKKYKYCCGK